MTPGDVVKVKAEITRLQDMKVRLESVYGETEDEMGALEDGKDELTTALEYLTEVVDFAEGRKQPYHEKGETEIAKDERDAIFDPAVAEEKE